MKKETGALFASVLCISLLLSSCGSESTEIVAETPTMMEETGISDTTSIPENTTTEGAPIGEQSNLAPSDTPRGIAEGGIYLPYTPTALAQASGNIVLFFYASWSPSGIATNKDITDKKTDIPKDLTILRVSFDDADEMKEQYGITDQQTFVQVTNTGELIKKWRGANTLGDIVQQIQK